MQLCFVGTSECGKSTLVTLLHLRARDLVRQKGKLFFPKTMVYRWRGDSNGGLDLPGMGETLKRGFPLPATPPYAGVRKSLMSFSFKTWFLQNRDLAVSVIDSAGGLQQELFTLLPPGLKWDDNDFEKIRRNRGVSRDVYEEFVSTVFDSDAFLFVIDAEKACLESRNLGGSRQEKSFETFVSNIHAYKDVNRQTSKLKGFGVLVTKIDKVAQMAVTGREMDRAKLEEFVEENLGNGWAALLGLCHDFKIKPVLFYHLLHPTNDYGKPNCQWFQIDGNQSIDYPRDQYDLLIKWFRKLIKKKFDIYGGLN